MVSQHFDDPAVGYLPACALHDHAFEFGFQRGQAGKAAFNFGQLRSCDGIGGGWLADSALMPSCVEALP